MGGISELLGMADRREPGPWPGFAREHLVLAFLALGETGRVGRQGLAKSSGLGEGSMRTILKRFREAGLVKIDPAGIILTDPGKRVFLGVLSKLTPPLSLGGTTLTVGKMQAVILVKASGKGISSGIEQRDASVRVGADGTTSYSYKGGRFAVPGGSQDCERDYPSTAWKTLREKLGPKNGDAVVVCGAKDEILAKLGALAAALTLL